MEKLKLLAQSISQRIVSNKLISRGLHSFWQAALTYLTVQVVVGHHAFHTVGEVKLLVAGAIGAGLFSLKEFVLATIRTYRG